MSLAAMLLLAVQPGSQPALLDAFRTFCLAREALAGSRRICEIRAAIGPLDEDNDLLDPVVRLTGGVFVGGNPGRPRSAWNIPGRRGFVRVAIDRSDPSNVGVILSIEPAQ